MFETTARKLVCENPRVEFIYAATVSGLLFDGQGCDHAAAAGHGKGTQLNKAVTGWSIWHNTAVGWLELVG